LVGHLEPRDSIFQTKFPCAVLANELAVGIDTDHLTVKHSSLGMHRVRACCGGKAIRMKEVIRVLPRDQLAGCADKSFVHGVRLPAILLADPITDPRLIALD